MEGKKVDKSYALKLLKEQANELASKAPKGNKYHLAAQYFSSQITGEEYADFLTLCVYRARTELFEVNMLTLCIDCCIMKLHLSVQLQSCSCILPD